MTIMLEALRRAGLIRDEDIQRAEEERRQCGARDDEPSRHRDRIGRLVDRTTPVIEGFGPQQEGHA